MPVDEPKPLRVFLSYSHDSARHAERVLALTDRLRRDGIDAWIDQYEPEPEKGWVRWMQDEIERADRVLAICTETYRRRFEGKETDGGQGVDWEGAILSGELYRRRRKFVVPVVFERDDVEHPPVALRDATYHVLDGESGYEGLYRVLTEQPATPAPALGRQKTLAPQPRRSSFGFLSQPVASPEPGKSAAVAAYREWATERYGHLELIGLGAAELRIELDKIYVPLRILERPERDLDLEGVKGKREAAFEGWNLNVELDRLFLHGGDEDVPRHALIFGEPGSGKTTALKKLHQLVLVGGPEALGLPAGTLPVFLRLRRFTPALLEEEASLPAFLEAELQELSGERLPEGLGAELWERRRLLLLFDGLDEIADETHRAKVLRRVAWSLGDGDLGDVRAVVSCRYSGWTEEVRDTKLDGFWRLDVRPFDDEQIALLIELWFREVVRGGFLDETTAEDRTRGLIRVLTDPEHRRQDFLTIVSTPLLLTLLCLVVMRGGEIPRRRVDFYEECLRILLKEWRARRLDRKLPISVDRAVELLADLAWYLHSNHRRDDLTFLQLRRIFLKRLGDPQRVSEAFSWLLDDVAILERFTEKHYGFVHLGLQEHLTARHLVENEADLDAVCEEWDDSWWAEVFQLLGSLPGGKGFAPLLRRLLATNVLFRRADLLAACLREADDPDLEPFYEVLREDGDAERQTAVLSLLRGRSESELLELAQKFADEGSGAVQEMATQVLLRAFRPEEAFKPDVFLVYGSRDGGLTKELAGFLGGRGLEVDSPPAGRGWDEPASFDQMARCSQVLVLVGEDGAEFEELTMEDLGKAEATVVLLPGDPRPVIPEALADLPHVDLPSFKDEPALDHLAGLLRPSAPPVEVGHAPLSVEVGGAFEVEIEKPFTEPLTGELFLPVPAGRFQMGGQALDREKPIHWVRLSPFWLARTPVTNRQYRQFIEAAGHEEPKYWRDRRFSDPEQPVVGVSWGDAEKYCEWLTETSLVGVTFELPTEAQWEYAARGTDGREFAWGNEPPDKERACFDLDVNSGRPAAVGSYPAGAGPFGHLDLAGNVWEWCRDLWEGNYDRWAKDEPLDPIGEADGDLRPLRGGSWLFDASFLRSARRFRDRPGYRDGNFGFRVSCASSRLKP